MTLHCFLPSGFLDVGLFYFNCPLFVWSEFNLMIQLLNNQVYLYLILSKILNNQFIYIPYEDVINVIVHLFTQLVFCFLNVVYNLLDMCICFRQNIFSCEFRDFHINFNKRKTNIQNLKSKKKCFTFVFSYLIQLNGVEYCQMPLNVVESYRMLSKVSFIMKYLYFRANAIF